MSKKEQKSQQLEGRTIIGVFLATFAAGIALQVAIETGYNNDNSEGPPTTEVVEVPELPQAPEPPVIEEPLLKMNPKLLANI